MLTLWLGLLLGRVVRSTLTFAVMTPRFYHVPVNISLSVLLPCFSLRSFVYMESIRIVIPDVSKFWKTKTLLIFCQWPITVDSIVLTGFFCRELIHNQDCSLPNVTRFAKNVSRFLFTIPLTLFCFCLLSHPPIEVEHIFNPKRFWPVKLLTRGPDGGSV